MIVAVVAVRFSSAGAGFGSLKRKTVLEDLSGFELGISMGSTVGFISRD